MTKYVKDKKNKSNIDRERVQTSIFKLTEKQSFSILFSKFFDGKLIFFTELTKMVDSMVPANVMQLVNVYATDM